MTKPKSRSHPQAIVMPEHVCASFLKYSKGKCNAIAYENILYNCIFSTVLQQFGDGQDEVFINLQSIV